MDRDEIERQLRELQALRRQGAITPEEAYRRHEELVANAAPLPTQQQRAAFTPPYSIERDIRETQSALRPRLLVAGLVLAVIVLGIGAFYVALRAAGVLDNANAASSNETFPPTIQPAEGAFPSATPGTGCYDGGTANDRLEVVSVDPPVSGPGPTTSIRVIVRYTLDSHLRARIVLQANTGTGARPIGPPIVASRGSGVVTLIQTGQLPDPASTTYSIYMHPPEDAYASFTCWRPLYVLPLNYSR